MLGYAGRYFSTSHFYLIEDAWAKDEEISISDQKIMFGVTVLLLMISKISLGLVADRYFVPGLIFTVTNISSFFFQLFSNCQKKSYTNHLHFIFLIRTVCALSGLGFIFGNKIGWYIAAYAITGLAIPGSWIGIIGVVARWIPISRQGRTMGTISTVYLVGDAITSIVIKSLIEIEVPWRGIVCVCAVTCFLTNIPAIFFLFSTPKRLNLPEPPTRTMNLITTSSKPNSFLDIVRPLSKSRAFWFLNVLALTIYGVNEFFMIFSKKYLIKIYCTSHELTFYETFDDCMTSHVASNYAFWASLILPISGIASSLATGYLKDGIAKRHRSTLIVSFLIGLLLFLMIMQLFFPCPMPIACIFIVCCGITLIGPYTLLSGAFILDVGGKYRSASASSFVNTTGRQIITCYFSHIIYIYPFFLSEQVSSVVYWFYCFVSM